MAAFERQLEAAPGCAGAAASLVVVWRAVEGALHPMLGPGGVAAMYRRSLAASAVDHPFLPSPAPPDAPPDLDALQAALSAQGRDAAVAAGTAFLQAFQDLLASLVGPSLTARLLAPVLDVPLSGHAAQDPIA